LLIFATVASNSRVIITDNIKDIEFGKFDIEVLTPKDFLERYKS